MTSSMRTLLPPKALIGMVHVEALPGTPHSARAVAEIAKRAAAEAECLVRHGFDAVMIENMHDRPYLLRQVGPEVVAAMTAVGLAVRQAVDAPLGVQVLAGANEASLAVALACGAQFVRVEGFVFAHVADEGLMGSADAGPLLRYRRQIGAADVAIAADVKKKHSSHAVTADVSLAETAEAAEFFGADAVIVTGTATGRPTSPEDVHQVRGAVRVPVWIGSGVTADNLAAVWTDADALIVGSYIKRDGRWSNALDETRCRLLMTKVAELRKG